MSEPTIGDVLAAVQALAAKLDAQGETLAGHGLALEALNTKVDAQGATLTGHSQALKTLAFNFAARAELDESRHAEVTQALEALADLAHTHHAQLAGLPEDIGGDIRAAEARVTSRLEDLRRAVHALKTDFVRHTNDPHAHHRHGNAA